ncbi:MAG: redoxin domain-containing protein, partial [Phycisphaeraceae bacterium]|nr:redoxin domain-containing protein [Phycisphaeraceae bacterium]
QANINNEARAKKLAAEAAKRRDTASARERMWIDALVELYASVPDPPDDKDKKKTETKPISKKEKRARDKKRFGLYAKRLREIVKAHPDDPEAKAFLAVRLWQNKRKGHPIKNYDENEKLIQSVLAVEPMHPIHHYRIHTWDRKKPAVALTSAARCGQSAPAIAHMWHMPGHIYSRLHRYADAAWQQEASARVDHAHMMRDRVMPDQIHNYAHNNEWLIRNLMNIGRVNDALRLAMNMVELPRHPRYNRIEGGQKGSARYGRQRLIQVLSRFELWDRAIGLCRGPYLEPTESVNEQMNRLRLLGRACFETGRLEEGRKIIKTLEQRLRTARADEKRKKEASTIDKVLKELTAHRLLADRKPAEALKHLKKIRSYDKVHLSMAYWKANDRENALKTAAAAVSSGKQAIRPLAHHAYLLYEAGRTKEAGKLFDRVATLGAKADLDVPCFKRLAPLADARGRPVDWRVTTPPKEDVGQRPDLNSLGPFRWKPSPAPDFSLPDDEGLTRRLSEFQGKPVVLIFYLGAGCLHCVDQLNAFAPMTEAYAKAG